MPVIQAFNMKRKIRLQIFWFFLQSLSLPRKLTLIFRTMKSREKPGLRPVAAVAARHYQKQRINEEVVLLCIFAAEWFLMEEMHFTDEYRREKCLEKLREILGGPNKRGYLQERMNQEMDGVLDRLSLDFKNIKPIEVLIFSHGTAGLTNDLSARLAGLSCARAASVIKSRLRERFLLSRSPRAQEYLALLPQKGCRFGEEMLYLHNLKYSKKWKL